MAEYIEREAAIKAIDHEVSLDGLYANIKAVPAADVRPERHGRWADTSINLYDGSGEKGYQCSVCKDVFFVEQSEIVYYKFCPHCGAKMSWEDNDNG